MQVGKHLENLEYKLLAAGTGNLGTWAQGGLTIANPGMQAIASWAGESGYLDLGSSQADDSKFWNTSHWQLGWAILVPGLKYQGSGTLLVPRLTTADSGTQAIGRRAR